jgi:hypothetical protein
MNDLDRLETIAHPQQPAEARPHSADYRWTGETQGAMSAPMRRPVLATIIIGSCLMITGFVRLVILPYKLRLMELTACFLGMSMVFIAWDYHRNSR